MTNAKSLLDARPGRNRIEERVFAHAADQRPPGLGPRRQHQDDLARDRLIAIDLKAKSRIHTTEVFERIKESATRIGGENRIFAHMRAHLRKRKRLCARDRRIGASVEIRAPLRIMRMSPHALPR